MASGTSESDGGGDTSTLGDSGDSGPLPDCFADEGCSCVLGLCAGNPSYMPLACVDEICVPATCGNGEIDPGEACDDNDAVTANDCTIDCAEATCGDGSLHMIDEWCDGDPAICGVGCDAEPPQWVSTSVASDCALAAGEGGVVYAALGAPTNEIHAYDAALELVWAAGVIDGQVRSVTTHGAGDVVAGITETPSGSTTSWLRRWTADGVLLGDTPLAAEQTAERIRGLERHGDDIWVLTDSADFQAESGDQLCRYDAALEPVWCTNLNQFGDASNEWPYRFALSSDGRAAVAAQVAVWMPDGRYWVSHARLWLVDADGTVELSMEVEPPPLGRAVYGMGLAFAPDGDALALGFSFGGWSVPAAVVWGVYDLDGTPQRLAQSTVEDVYYTALVGWAPSGDLVIGQSVSWGNNYPWIRVESSTGEHRYTRRGAGASGFDSQLCDLVVTDEAVVTLGTSRLPERTFMTRFELE